MAKILVVDDNRQLVREIRSHLEKLGYEVTTAKDGISALKLTQSITPDLVVLDLNFPSSKRSSSQAIDGLEVLQRLRDSGCNVPVLVLSATNISAVRRMAISMGAQDYLTKPVELQELSSRIEAILRGTGPESPDAGSPDDR
jgi:DNA-binding response OmpR family regulator